MEGVRYAKQMVLEQSSDIKPLFKLFEQDNNNKKSLSLLDATNCKLGDIIVEKAIGSDFQAASGLTDKQLHNCAVIHTPNFSDQSEQEKLLPVLCYFALREARTWGCQNIIFCSPKNNVLSQTIQTLLRLSQLDHCCEISLAGSQQLVFAQRIKYSIIHTYSRCDASFKPFIQSQFIHEILSTFENWVTGLFQQSWFTAVHSKTISKEQYVTSLYNLHQFVKHTTRLAARCVANSENRELRNHYINHLKGEINHETIIESDLAGLDADVDYLLNEHVAHTATSEFITVQESIIGFKQDPVLMLACPFIAEGMTANIDYQFVTDLHDTIKTWGIENPESVSRFLTSHMKTDGGVDGHWLRVVIMVNKFIKSEQMLQHFLCTMRLAMSAYAHGLNANIDDLELWRPSQASSVANNAAEKSVMA